jgi:hypothetical protein
MGGWWWASADAVPRTVDRDTVAVQFEHDSALGPGPIGDINGDGLTDLTAYSQEAGVGFIVFGAAGSRSGDLPKVDVRLETVDHTMLALASAQDYDGDGLRDLLVSTLAQEPESFRRTGASYLIRGRRVWPETIRIPAEADVTFAYPQATDIRVDACHIDDLVDLNGDGLADVVLGAADYSPETRASAGGAFIFFGRRTWPAELDLERDADVVVAGSRAGEGLSGHCGTGDFNGDGRQDLALVATEDTLWSLREGRGRYYVFFGRDRWPQAIDTAVGADVRIDGDRANARNVGPVLADVNGDGLHDLAMVATHADTTPDRAAEIAIVFGRLGHQPLTRRRIDADVVLTGQGTLARLGPAARATDLDDDGVVDLFLSVTGTGACLALRGRTAWPARAQLSDVASPDLCRPGATHGERGLRLGDVDDDGTPDLLTTGPAAGIGGNAQHRAWTASLYAPIRIDVRPGKEPNILYLPGLVVVSVDASTLPPGDAIDPQTARVAGVASTRRVWVDEGGRRRLQLYFDTARMHVTPETTHVTLTAHTRAGRLVRGRDQVVVMPGPER